MTIQLTSAFSLGAPIYALSIPFGTCPNISSSAIESCGQGQVLDLANQKLYSYSTEEIVESPAVGASTLLETVSPNSYNVQGASSGQTKQGILVMSANSSGMLIKQNKSGGWSTEFQVQTPAFLSNLALKYGLGVYSALDYSTEFVMSPGVPGKIYVGYSGTTPNSQTGNGGYGLVAYSPAGQIITKILETTGEIKVTQGGQAFFFGPVSGSPGLLLTLEGTGIALPSGYETCYYFGSWPQGDVFILETSNNLILPVLYTGTNVLSPLVISGPGPAPVFTALSAFSSSSDSSTVGSTLGKYGAILGIAGVDPAGWLIDFSQLNNTTPLLQFKRERFDFCFCTEDYENAVLSTF